MKFITTLALVSATASLLSLSACSKSDNATTTTNSTADSTKTTKASGGSSSSSPIVGTWQDADGAETITYKADGTMTEKLSSGDVVNGTYSMVDAGHIKVKFDGAMAAMGEQTFPVTINGDTMDVTGPSGAAQHYKRTAK